MIGGSSKIGSVPGLKIPQAVKPSNSVVGRYSPIEPQYKVPSGFSLYRLSYIANSGSQIRGKLTGGAGDAVSPSLEILESGWSAGDIVICFLSRTWSFKGSDGAGGGATWFRRVEWEAVNTEPESAGGTPITPGGWSGVNVGANCSGGQVGVTRNWQVTVIGNGAGTPRAELNTPWASGGGVRRHCESNFGGEVLILVKTSQVVGVNQFSNRTIELVESTP